jgi:hypothetical protein
VEAARARLQIEAELRDLVERAERACAAGVFPEAGKIWLRGQIGETWLRVKERLKAGDVSGG